MISEKEGSIYYQYTNDMTYLKFKGQELLGEEQAVTGFVTDFTKEMSLENKIVVKLNKDICADSLADIHIDIETDRFRNGF